MKGRLETPELLKYIFSNNWENIFIYDSIEERAVTYGIFFNNILTLKARLEELGAEKGDKICIALPNSYALAVFYFAALSCELTAVPVDPQKGAEDIKEVLEQLEYKLMIYDSSDEERFGILANSYQINMFKTALLPECDNSKNALEIFNGLDYDRPYLLTFTSGSTGMPKGVLHSFNNLARSALSFSEVYQFNKENVFYNNLPMTYMAGILNLLIMPFLAGSRLVIGERFNISNLMNFWDAPVKYSVNTFWFVPTIITLLLKLDRGTKGTDYTAGTSILGCVGTAPLNPDAREAFQQKYNFPLYESYGLSETLFVTTNYPGRTASDHSVGEVLEGVSLFIEDDGEILIQVPWMFKGYSNIETSEFFTDGKYRSGDFGKIDDKGFLYITGRKKDLIIKGGINISPKKIEDFLSRFDYFDENTITGVEDATLGEKTVCFFAGAKQPFETGQKKDLNKAITEKLGADYRIDDFVELLEMPRTASGKVDRPKLRSDYRGGSL